MAADTVQLIPWLIALVLTVADGTHDLESRARFPLANAVPSVSFVETADGAQESSRYITLAWDPPTDGLATSYVVEAGSAPGLSDIAAFDTGTANTVLFVGPVPPGTYYVRVRARDGAGLSDPSNEIIVTVEGGEGSGPGACAAPAPPTNLTSAISGPTVALRWTRSPDATSYHLEAGSMPGASDLFSGDVGNQPAFGGTVPPGTYFVRVRATTHCGTSAPSREIRLDIRPR